MTCIPACSAKSNSANLLASQVQQRFNGITHHFRTARFFLQHAVQIDVNRCLGEPHGYWPACPSSSLNFA